MSLNRVFCVLTAAVAAVCAACPAPAASGWPASFRELTDLRQLAVTSPFTTHQFSSYDRTGGNADWGHFLWVEGNRKVLADIKGPGEIVRIWSANPSGELDITIDGVRFAGAPFADFFNGSFEPFAPPLSTTSSGGSISYFPIPFRASALVEAVDAGNFYYQVTYRKYGAEAAESRASAADGMAATDTAALTAAQRIWTLPGSLPAASPATDPIVAAGVTEKLKKSVLVAPGKSAEVALLKGGGYISEIRFLLPVSRMTALRQTRLVARWDGAERPGVDTPLLDLFGSSFELKDFRSLLVGRGLDNWWYVRFPMPFRQTARLTLVNESKQALQIHATITWVKGAPRADALYYRTAFNLQTTGAGKPHPVLHASGRGQFAGVSMSMQGTGGLGFLEGDELVSVDGRPHTDYNGTGTEDYFNSGWYFREGWVWQPLHGCLVKDEAASRISVYRYHLTDRVPFTEKIAFDIEHGGVNDAPGAVYASLAHWYSGSPGDAATPAVQARGLSIPRKRAAFPAHAIALSSLNRTGLSGGSVKTVDWKEISETTEGGPLVLFTPKRVGNAISYSANVPFSDRVEVALWTAGGPGLGKVRVSLDQRTVGEADLWSPLANHPQRLIIGEIPIKKGPHTLTLRSVGRSPGSAGLTIAVSHIEFGSASPPVADWAVLGPFDAPGKGLQTAFINETGPLDTGRDYAGASGPIRWRSERGEDGVLNLGDRPNSVCYAAATVTAAEAGETEMLLGSDDGVQVWINGSLVHERDVQRALVPDDDRVKVRLRAGANSLLFKVHNQGGPAALAVRFRDPDGTLRSSSPALDAK